MNAERLLQLADHLEKGRLGHEVFDFSMINNSYHKCGTAGCAMGEFPILWPNDWKFIYQGITLEGYEHFDLAWCIEEWLTIDFKGLRHLFTPSAQMPLVYGGIKLTEDATKEQVASNIRAFVARHSSPATV